MTALVTLWAGGFLAMLDDGTRVISHRGLYRLLGLSERAAGRRADKNPRFLGSKALSPFVSAALLAPTRNPISYRTHGGRTAANAVPAATIVDLCSAVLAARRAGALHHKQRGMAERAEEIVEALAKVGLTALIDEATGYQDVRPDGDLQRLLDLYATDRPSASPAPTAAPESWRLR